MKRNLFVWLALIVALIFALAFAPAFWHMLRGVAPDAVAERDLPWQVQALPDGSSRVFGLALGSGRLADARARWSDSFELALLVDGSDAATLEAYVENAQLGFVSGRLIFSAQLPAAQMQGLRARASKIEPLASGAHRYTLAAQDLALADQAVLLGISLIPSLQLDAALVTQRFGAPAERLTLQGLEHWLYPAQGLAISLDPKGRELLQYVAPAEFARLREPLLTVQKSGAQ
ncbi:hypothetical protein [Paucibacter soli]|uniref:hypothetical protein n=1 Tax=Paucibacter soli TaxID=3133433 RepID=UPI0030A0B8F8